MKKTIALLALALTGLFALGLRAPAVDGPAPGDPAPAIDAKTWFNHIGRPLTLDNLGGNAVLVEFWATW